ncbi:hypothetical protein [Rhizobium ruizarguesonis]|uniref:hypothetical protein n=1 Tax=Rhizobium ruizarguesonis TaxID=2081791 RepID=UPI00102F74D8|nr:hypothetical protein [Rhizobium ruizarguesonis]TBD34337.1 hypothetical protein ELH17_30595 [Rhizobium ruizarguesonis]TBD55057.1 hypothetical protein ELH16_34585 [Rhizobium ruizarguesonis]TBF01959.1 hypothetical protein ELG96_32435 [Rhizobium ruizarguesonis]
MSQQVHRHQLQKFGVPRIAQQLLGAYLTAFVCLGLGISGAKAASLSPDTVGVFVTGAGPILEREDRFGPPDVVVFGRDQNPYMWVYFPALGSEADEATSVFAKTLGGDTKEFANVVLATKTVLSRRGITGDFRLVQLRVNGGLGSGDDEKFVANEIRIIDGTPEFRLLDPIANRLIGGCNDRLLSDQSLLEAAEQARMKSRVKLGKLEVNRVLLPRITWLSQRSEVALSCDLEVSESESRLGIGNVRTPSSGDESTEGSKYGLRFSAVTRESFSIDRAGNADAGTRTPIQTTVESQAPPGYSDQLSMPNEISPDIPK